MKDGERETKLADSGRPDEDEARTISLKILPPDSSSSARRCSPTMAPSSGRTTKQCSSSPIFALWVPKLPTRRSNALARKGRNLR